MFLQRTDLMTDCRLGQVEFVCCGGETGVARGTFKCTKPWKRRKVVGHGDNAGLGISHKKFWVLVA